ncbi:MAG: cobalamin biosynthesis protein [Treponemataceae bacterium]|nr:cobalamin biosynthesis protein [Treponemataceae bacterium]
MVVYVCSFTEQGRRCEESLCSRIPEINWISWRSLSERRNPVDSGLEPCDCGEETAACKRETVACEWENVTSGLPAVGYEPASCGPDSSSGLPAGKKLSARDFAGQAFRKHLPLLFIGAAGIAVRMSADYVKDKFSDSPVLVADEKLNFVIPLLSGHMGGANELAHFIAARLGALPVITTASDVEEIFSVDVFARRNGFSIVNRDSVKGVTGKLLSGERAVVWIDPSISFPRDKLPGELFLTETGSPPENADIIILPENQALGQGARADGSPASGGNPGRQSLFCPASGGNPGRQSLFCPASGGNPGKESLFPGLRPSCLVLRHRPYCVGIGCKKGKTFDELFAFFDKTLPKDIRGKIRSISSIDLKKNEIGLMELAQYYHVPFLIYSAEKLAALSGFFSESAFVEKTTGVSNVCERAAVKAACSEGPEAGNTAAEAEAGDSCLLIRKIAGDGITVAVAKKTASIFTWDTAPGKAFL